LLGAARLRDIAADSPQLSPARRALLKTVGTAPKEHSRTPRRKLRGGILLLLERIGCAVEGILHQALQLLGSIGMTLETLTRSLFRPSRWRVASLAAHVEQIGLDAVPIVALLSFLVGAVVAFLGATVLADFGATIYKVDLISISLFA
jgi:phospholipid/cholesterol/gamma-HCH transport system permease protein